jgi:nucleotide-binding universal stress UspA family protein
MARVLLDQGIMGLLIDMKADAGTAEQWRRQYDPSTRESCERGRSWPSIRHVLVPLDGSKTAECVLPFAALMAQAFGARLTLLRVLETHGGAAPSQHVDPLQWEISRIEARNELNRIAGELEPARVAPSVEIVSGAAAEQIIQFAEAQHVDLIVLSSHGEGGLSRWLLSSTVQKVVSRAPTSVLIVPAYACPGRRIGDLRLASMLLPLDCSPRAEGILPLAAALARIHDGELILAHVVPEPELPRRMSPSAGDLTLAAQLNERNRAEAERYLGELHSQVVAQGARARVRVVVSPRCDRALRGLADEENVDLILLSAHGKTGDAGERYGAVAARLMQSSNRPVIIVQDLAGVLRAVNLAEEAMREHPGH